MKYVRDMSWKRDPVIAADRKALAKVYRDVRRDRPDLGRLLFVRYRAAIERMKRDMATNLFSIGE